MSAAKADPFGRRLLRGVLEALLLVIITVAAAAVLQATRAKPLPLDLPPSVWGIEAHARWIDTPRALELHRSGDGLFVDVRPPEEYADGHIAGAMNLPPALLFDLYDDFASWTEGQQLVFYGSRDDSFDLDKVLMELEKMGHTGLLAFPEGWEGWVDAKGSTEEGEDPLLGQDDAWDDEMWDDGAWDDESGEDRDEGEAGTEEEDTPLEEETGGGR